MKEASVGGRMFAERTSGGGAEASLCSGIFAESDTLLKSQTVGRIDAHETPVNNKSLRRCWCGRRVELRRNDAATTFAV